MSNPTDPTHALAPGQQLPVTITDVAFGGEGVARAGEFVVFVPFTLPGETVEIEVTEVKKRFARARLLKVLTASPDRVKPECQYFGDCGGCQYQHASYGAQLQFKHKQVSDLMERIGGLPRSIVAPVVLCPSPYGYRNRIMIRSQWNKPKQKLNIGFIGHDNRFVVDITECKIAEPEVSRQIQHVRDNPPPKGGLKVVLRLPPENWAVPRDSFFQNNFHLLPGLVEAVRERLQDSGSRHLIDAYCGVGFFAIELADMVESYIGVELDRSAIKAAMENAASRARTNGEFLTGRTEDLLPSILNRFPADSTTLVLDPPRTGCPPHSLELLREVRPAQVIYVSCHPATLARDLNVLCRDGVFEVVKIIPLDMFPQTQHVECVADVRRKTDPSESAHSSLANQPAIGSTEHTA